MRRLRRGAAPRRACGLLSSAPGALCKGWPMPGAEGAGLAPAVWQVGALCRAVADTLSARFNPVGVRGEITGFSRAASGHCYFTLKDRDGQIRCAMFRRSAAGLGFAPRDGELVEVSGRLGVYEARGDLQLIVEDMRRAGQGALFEEFLRLKAALEAEGLFDAARKRPLPAMPRAIGVITSTGAAALHDVVTALRRRVPHIPVVLVPALVQGAQAPASLCEALSKMYQLAERGRGLAADAAAGEAPAIDAILLVRGGGSIEDLWAFNDERVARMVVQSPVPLVSGVGHETDFTIADFCADLRAPTPTAAAELVSQPREVWLGALELLAQRLADGAQRQIDLRLQRLDMAAQRLGRPSGLAARQELQLARLAQRMRHAALLKLQHAVRDQQGLQADLPAAMALALQRRTHALEQLSLRLELLNPQLVLQRGYALLTDERGQPVTDAARLRTGDALLATLAQGRVDLTVSQRRLL